MTETGWTHWAGGSTPNFNVTCHYTVDLTCRTAHQANDVQTLWYHAPSWDEAVEAMHGLWPIFLFSGEQVMALKPTLEGHGNVKYRRPNGLKPMFIAYPQCLLLPSRKVTPEEVNEVVTSILGTDARSYRRNTL